MPETINPYNNPDFARNYVLNQLDRSKNRYEWEVTSPAMLQFIDNSVDKVLDYGTGSGIFTLAMTDTMRSGQHHMLDVIGTDGSAEMIRYAKMLEVKAERVRFERWDANVESSSLQNKSFDRVFAKLVFNYLSGDNLRLNVMPRLRECLKDDGLLIATLPNPLREAGYSQLANEEMERVGIDIGNFSPDHPVNSYHHTFETMLNAAAHAGFSQGAVVGLPEVRFEPYRKSLMKIANPMPMIFGTLNAAKRWIYVFGVSEAAEEKLEKSVALLETWRGYYYPEIADRAHIRLLNGNAGDVLLPLNLPHDALYDYTGDASNTVITVKGKYVEHLDPRQKIKLAKKLAALGLRNATDIQDFLVSR